MLYVFPSLGLSLTTFFPLIFILCLNQLVHVQAQDQNTGDTSDSSPEDQNRNDQGDPDIPPTTTNDSDNSEDDTSLTPTSPIESTPAPEPSADPTETPTETPLIPTSTIITDEETPTNDPTIETTPPAVTESEDATTSSDMPTMTSDPILPPSPSDTEPTSIENTPVTTTFSLPSPTSSIEQIATSISISSSSSSSSSSSVSVSSPSIASDQTGGGGLSSTQTSIIGGVIGGVAGLVLVGAIVVWTVRRTKKQREAVDFEAFNPQLEYDDHLDATTGGGRAARWSKVQTSMSQPYEVDDNDQHYHRY